MGKITYIFLFLMVFIVSFIFITVAENHNDNKNNIVLEEKETTEEVVERLFPEVKPYIGCSQLRDNEKIVPNSPNPQVLCASDVLGMHYWYRVDENDVEHLLYISDFATKISTVFFTTNPVRIRVRVIDSNRNIGESEILVIETDLKACELPLCRQIWA